MASVASGEAQGVMVFTVLFENMETPPPHTPTPQHPIRVLGCWHGSVGVLGIVVLGQVLGCWGVGHTSVGVSLAVSLAVLG